MVLNHCETCNFPLKIWVFYQDVAKKLNFDHKMKLFHSVSGTGKVQYGIRCFKICLLIVFTQLGSCMSLLHGPKCDIWQVQVAPSFCFQINFNSESMFFDHVRARINGPCGIFIALDLSKMNFYYVKLMCAPLGRTKI